MKRTKEMLVSVMVVALFVSIFIAPASAGTTDTFTVTVRGKYLDIQVNQTTWSINSDNAIDMSSIYYSNASTTPYFTAVLYNNSVAVDLKLHVSTDGTTWNCGANPGADVYRANATHDLWVTPGECIVLTGGAQTLKSAITAGTNQTFDMRFDAPTSTTTGDLQTITITATVAEN